MTPAVVISAPAECTPRASSRSIHSPDSRVSRPTTNRSGRPVAVEPPHRAHQRAAEARDGLVVERIFSRLSANAVSAKQSMGHLNELEIRRDLRLLDRHVDDGGIDGADAEGLRRVHLDAKIVSAGTQTVKVHERVDDPARRSASASRRPRTVTRARSG